MITGFIDTFHLIEWGGLALIIALIFAETGLLLGLIIPAGESLIFTCGVLCSTGMFDIKLVPLIGIIVVAGIAGDLSGFFIGRKAGRKLFDKKDTWYFKKKYLKGAELIFSKHKTSSIIFGKFLPVVRPFIPAIAGTTQITIPKFFVLSLLSCLLFMGVFATAGYYLGLRFPVIKEYLFLIVPASILIALTAVALQIRKYRRELNDLD